MHTFSTDRLWPVFSTVTAFTSVYVRSLKVIVAVQSFSPSVVQVAGVVTSSVTVAAKVSTCLLSFAQVNVAVALV